MRAISEQQWQTWRFSSRPFLFAALAGSALIWAILYGLCWRWQPSYAKGITLSVIAALVAVFLSAFGNADGGPLNFRAAPLFLLAQAVVLAFDLIRIRRKKAAMLKTGAR